MITWSGTHNQRTEARGSLYTRRQHIFAENWVNRKGFICDSGSVTSSLRIKPTNEWSSHWAQLCRTTNFMDGLYRWRGANDDHVDMDMWGRYWKIDLLPWIKVKKWRTNRTISLYRSIVQLSRVTCPWPSHLLRRELRKWRCGLVHLRKGLRTVGTGSPCLRSRNLGTWRHSLLR